LVAAVLLHRRAPPQRRTYQIKKFGENPLLAPARFFS
jgi:hypothetical protein